MFSDMEKITRYFPELSPLSVDRLAALPELYAFWNERINVISRKDMEHFAERHLLHSLSVGMIYPFQPGTEVLDVGTGGGFPGIPLAIMFPEVQFTLVDSIGKKIRVVNEVCQALNLTNVKAEQVRVETMPSSFDFVVSRAVTSLPGFVALAGSRVRRQGFNNMPNGIIYLKGGDFGPELRELKGWYHRVTPLDGFFDGEFFSTKKLVLLSRKPLS
jgi:16S rRNA (guanine527-N7)-methyltransferase